MEKKYIIYVVLALFIAEIFLLFNEFLGFIMYFALIAIYLLSLSHQKTLNEYSKIIIVFMIIPIVRIIGLFIPLGFFWKVLISYSILLFLAFYYSVRFKLDHGHKKEKLSLLPVALGLGILLGYIGQGFFDYEYYNWFVLMIPLIAYSEEILFRGMMQNLIEKSSGVVMSFLIPAFLYGIFSLVYGFSFGVFMFAVGLILGIFYFNNKNIFLTTLMNLIIHLFIFSYF